MTEAGTGALEAAPWPDEETLRSTAEAVLAREEYARFRIVDADWLRALQEWLERYLSWTRELSESSPLLFALFLIGLLGLAGLLTAHVVWSLRVALRNDAGVVDAPVATSRRDYAGEAQAFADAGHLLDACRALQLACLDLLIREGDLDLARHHTNQALRAKLRRSSLPEALRTGLIRGIDGLERSWFRDRETPESLYESWRTLYADVRRAVA